MPKWSLKFYFHLSFLLLHLTTSGGTPTHSNLLIPYGLFYLLPPTCIKSLSSHLFCPQSKWHLKISGPIHSSTLNTLLRLLKLNVYNLKNLKILIKSEISLYFIVLLVWLVCWHGSCACVVDIVHATIYLANFWIPIIGPNQK